MTNFEIVQAMRTYGGGFARALADAWMHADPENQARICLTWPELWAEYEDLARRAAAQQQAEARDGAR